MMSSQIVDAILRKMAEQDSKLDSSVPIVSITKVDLKSSPESHPEHRNTDFSIESLLRKDSPKVKVTRVPHEITGENESESPSFSDEVNSSEEDEFIDTDEDEGGGGISKGKHETTAKKAADHSRKRRFVLEDDDNEDSGSEEQRRRSRSFEDGREDYNNYDHRDNNGSSFHHSLDNNPLAITPSLSSNDKGKISTFSWLSCTRFKPPKLPRSSKKRSGCKRYGRGPRIPFAPHQIAVLENTFAKSQYLSSDCIHRLADTLHLSETRVKIWFQNRRARFRREKEPQLGTTATLQIQQSQHHHIRNANIARANQYLKATPKSNNSLGDAHQQQEIGNGNSSPVSSSGSDVAQLDLEMHHNRDAYPNIKSKREMHMLNQQHNPRLLVPDLFSYHLRQQHLHQYYLEQQRQANSVNSDSTTICNNHGDHSNVVSTSPLLHSALQQPPITITQISALQHDSPGHSSSPDESKYSLSPYQQQFHNLLRSSPNFHFTSPVPRLSSSLQLSYNPVKFT